MEITQEMIDFAEAQKWDNDKKQDAYVALLEKPEGYMKDVGVKALMTAIYNFKVIDEQRKDARHKVLVQENLQAVEGLHSTGDNCDPFDYLAADAVLQRADELSPLLKKTLYGYLNGVSVADMAKHERVDANTIYQRFHAIKQELYDVNKT